MRKLYLFFQDYKRVWKYSVVLMITIFLVMVCAAFVFEQILNVKYYCDRFNVEEYGDSRILHVDPYEMSATDKEYLYNEIVENDYGYALFTETDITIPITYGDGYQEGVKAQLNFAPPTWIGFDNIAYEGEWFSGNVGEVKEALVPYYISDKFEIGKVYEIDSQVEDMYLKNKKFTHKIKVIGYITGYKNDTDLKRMSHEYTMPFISYRGYFKWSGEIGYIIVCDNQMIKQYTPEEFFSCSYNYDYVMSDADALRLDKLKYATAETRNYREYIEYYQGVFEGRERGFILAFALVMIFLILMIVCNTVVSTEHTMRRQASSYIVGDTSNRNIASEIGIALVTFLLPCSIFVGSNFLSLYTDKLPILFIVVAGVFVIYAVITAISLFIKLRKKPIDTIKRQ